MGRYGLLWEEFNNHPAYQSEDGQRYIIFSSSGQSKWVIKDELSVGGNEAFYSVYSGPSPPLEGWRYKSNGAWHYDDFSITLTPIKGNCVLTILDSNWQGGIETIQLS